jgi:hypothetical protein
MLPRFGSDELSVTDEKGHFTFRPLVIERNRDLSTATGSDALESGDMRVRTTLVIAVFLMLSASMFAQDKNRYGLLPSSVAHDISRLCSREGISGVAGSWHPNADQIGLLESRSVRVSRLRSNGESREVQILQPDTYYRQYIPVLVGSQKLIYVNAFRTNRPHHGGPGLSTSATPEQRNGVCCMTPQPESFQTCEPTPH